MDIQSLIRELVALGEDEAELAVWERIFPTLSRDEQQAVLDSFAVELEELRRIKTEKLD